APTFRRDGSHIDALDTEKLRTSLGDEYILLMKQHPSVKEPIASGSAGFVYDVSDYYDINHLLLVTDILITDYSSTPFEFSLLKRPMVFFAYDIKDYKENQGLSQAYNEQMPGPIVYTTDDVIQAIQEEHINREFMN